VLPAVNRGTREAAIAIRSPVRGLTPARAERSPTWKRPKPGMLTSPPRPRVSAITAQTASTARAASERVRSVRVATCSVNSVLFTVPSVSVIGAAKLTISSDRRLRNNRGVGANRIAWLATVLGTLLAAALLGVSGYEGYAWLGVAVAASAAINLF